jgi:hypothetical protein
MLCPFRFLSGPNRMSTIQRATRTTSRFRWTPAQFQKAAEDGWFGDRKMAERATSFSSTAPRLKSFPSTSIPR